MGGPAGQHVVRHQRNGSRHGISWSVDRADSPLHLQVGVADGPVASVVRGTAAVFVAGQITRVTVPGGPVA